MDESPDKFGQFWQELKRRKVIRVITVYAAAAFVILELVSIIVDPLNLPGWTLTFVIMLLCVGFIMAIILSWIYDIHPDKGIVRTGSKEADKFNETSAPHSTNTWKIASYVSFVIILALLLLHIFSPGSADISNPDNSIAVLPFEDMSAQKDQEYFCDGMSEEIINSLTQLDGLKVIARTSTFAFKGRQLDIREIGRILEVGLILEGSVQKVGDRVRITAQLIRVADGSHIWSEQYERKMEDVFKIQDEISEAIVNKLRIRFVESYEEAASRQTSNMAAYNLYLKGRFYWHRRTEKDMRTSMELYNQALELDPDYALAYAGLADVYFIMTWWGHFSKEEYFTKAKDYAIKALEINDRLPEAHATLGGILTWYDWDWEGAERELKLAISLNPNDANALQYYSELMIILDRRKEARAYINRAQELNPHSQIMYNVSAGYYYNDGEYEKAVEECRKALAISDFGWPQQKLFNCFVMLGRDQQALESLREMISTDPGLDDNAILDSIYEESGMEGIIAWYIRWFQDNQSEDMYLRMPSQIKIARLYGLMGDPQLAIKHLNKAISERDINLPRIGSYPELNMLHDSAIFKSTLEEMGLLHISDHY